MHKEYVLFITAEHIATFLFSFFIKNRVERIRARVVKFPPSDCCRSLLHTCFAGMKKVYFRDFNLNSNHAKVF